MKEIEKRYKIAYLISLELMGGLSSKEKQTLQEWLSASDDNLQEYEHIRLRMKKDLQEENRINVSQEWKHFERRLNVPEQKIHRIRYYAAAICAGICICVGILWQQHRPEQTLVVKNIDETRSYKAMLILGNGEQVNITDSSCLFINKEAGAKISASNNILRYEADEATVSEQTEWNTVIVPRGAEYELLLADGTKVWLNSESQLTYPVRFTGTTREVRMSGEVCFEVHRNEQQPFVVKAGEVGIKVLGTFFNIEAYPENRRVITTLVNGSVEVSVGEIKKILQPNEQAIVEESQSVRVERIYARDYVSWTTGVFHFTETSLNDIMTKLSRWYNIEFFFAVPALKDANFSLDIQRYDHVSEILSKIEKTGRVKFRTEGNIVVVEEL